MTHLKTPAIVSSKSELVIIPKEEYDELLVFKKMIPFKTPSQADKVALRRGRQEVQAGLYKQWGGLKYELGYSRREKRRKTA